MNLDRLSLVVAVAVACLLAIGAQSGLLAGAAGSLVGSALNIEVPPLDDPVLIRRGGAHYDRVCARCHGSPVRSASAEAEALSPSPPILHQRVEGFPPEKLFEVIKHGVPGTGMPAWPVTDRDDEIWAMVAFVQRLPSLDAAAYSEIAGSAQAATDQPFAACARCHGRDGEGSADGAFPRLDIQSPEYLSATLAAFRDGRRSSGFMQSAVAGLAHDELVSAAEHFGHSLSAGELGKRKDNPTANGPSCAGCHGVAAPVRPDFPSLAGQHLRYLMEQFELLASREHARGGGPFIDLMHEVALTANEQDALVWLEWFSGAPMSKAPPGGER